MADVRPSPEVESWGELERKWFAGELSDDWCEFMRSTVVERIQCEAIFG